MHTTLSRSLALLVSMFALTSSFSLSTSEEISTETCNTMENDSEIKDPSDIVNLSRVLSKKKDQAPWIFQYTDNNDITNFNYFENEKLEKKVVDTGFIDNLELFIRKEFNLNRKNLYSIFRIYKREKNEIIGLAFNPIIGSKYGKKLVLCTLHEEKFALLKTGYAQNIQPREIDLSPNLFTNGTCSGDGSYVFDIHWLEPYQDYTGLKVFLDKNNKMQITDSKSLPPSNQSNPSKQSNPSNWSNAGLVFLVGVVLVILSIMYSKGCFSFLFQEQQIKATKKLGEAIAQIK